MFEEEARGTAGFDLPGLPLSQKPPLDEQFQKTFFVGRRTQSALAILKLFCGD